MWSEWVNYCMYYKKLNMHPLISTNFGKHVQYIPDGPPAAFSIPCWSGLLSVKVADTLVTKDGSVPLPNIVLFVSVDPTRHEKVNQI